MTHRADACRSTFQCFHFLLHFLGEGPAWLDPIKIQSGCPHLISTWNQPTYVPTLIASIVSSLQLVVCQQQEDSPCIRGQALHDMAEGAEGKSPWLLDQQWVLVGCFLKVRGIGGDVLPQPIEWAGFSLVPNCKDNVLQNNNMLSTENPWGSLLSSQIAL